MAGLRPLPPSGGVRASPDLEGVCKDRVKPDIPKPIDVSILADVGKSPSGGRSGDARTVPGGCAQRRSFRDSWAAAQPRMADTREMSNAYQINPDP